MDCSLTGCIVQVPLDSHVSMNLLILEPVTFFIKVTQNIFFFNQLNKEADSLLQLLYVLNCQTSRQARRETTSEC